MQRPVMNPLDTDPAEAMANGASAAATPLPRRRISFFPRWIWRMIKLLARVLLTDIRKLCSRDPVRPDKSNRLSRFIRGLLYRLALAPVMLALIAIVLVWAGTHPRVAVAEVDPTSQGLYYDPVNFLSDDGFPVSGWLVPVMDARRVLTEGDAVLTQKRPAVVLAPGRSGSPQRLMPLIKLLHDQGWVVLTVGTRSGDGAWSRGQTFGINESAEVTAAVRMLRRRPFVDPHRVAVVGIGCGANAAMLAADREPSITVLVLNSPITSGDDAVERFIGPQSPMLHWLNPACKWTFDLAYGVDADDLNLDRYSNLFASRPTLILPRGPGCTAMLVPRMEATLAFLRRYFQDSTPAATNPGK